MINHLSNTVYASLLASSINTDADQTVTLDVSFIQASAHICDVIFGANNERSIYLYLRELFLQNEITY